MHTSRGKPPASRNAACRGKNIAALRASPCSAFRPCSCRDSFVACRALAARRQNSSSSIDESSLHPQRHCKNEHQTFRPLPCGYCWLSEPSEMLS